MFGENEVKVFILIYVNDILLIRPNTGCIKSLIHDLNTQFSLKNLGEINFFLGIEAFRNNRGLHFCQAKYTTKLLEKTQM